MADTIATLKLTLGGAMKLLQAAIAKAAEIGVPECISIVIPAATCWHSPAWTAPSCNRSTPR